MRWRIRASISSLTGKDFPIPYGILPVSQDEHALAIDRVRFVGDPVAAVVARDELTAFEALDLIDVEYEPLTHVQRPRGKPRRSPSRGSTTTARAATSTRPCRSGSATSTQAFADADRVFEDTFFYQGNTHLPIEQHAAVAATDPDGKLVLWSSDADAALRPPRAREGARHAGGAHPRHRHAERRRLRRQERSVQPRDRRRQSGAAARPAGEDLPDARRGLLLPSRPASGADAVQDRREARRHDHRRCT